MAINKGGRKLILNRETIKEKGIPDGISNLSYQINKIGTNINQLSKVANYKNMRSPNANLEREIQKASELIVLNGVSPTLPLGVLEHHMENGLKEALNAVSKKQMDKKQGRILRESVYALGNLFGSKIPREEVFNGFKDELTDYSKYKGKGLWL